MELLLILGLGLVNWFGTVLVVESEFFRPLRDWIGARYDNAERRFTDWFWWKAGYMINCHMCAGTWVALALVPFAPALFGAGVLPYVVTGLLIKAIGHLILVVHKLGEEKTNRDKAEREVAQRTVASYNYPQRSKL